MRSKWAAVEPRRSDPIAYLVERTPALQAARERTFRGRRTPSYDDRIRLGQLFDEPSPDIASRTPRRSRPIGGACSEVIALPVREEKEIANLAALVPARHSKRFEAAVNAAAAQIDEDIVFNSAVPGRRIISCSSISEA